MIETLCQREAEEGRYKWPKREGKAEANVVVGRKVQVKAEGQGDNGEVTAGFGDVN